MSEFCCAQCEWFASSANSPSSSPTPSSHPLCPLLLRHTPVRACVCQDSEAHCPQAKGVEVVEESPGVKTLCAQFRDPQSHSATRAQTSHCSLSSSSFILPSNGTLTQGCRGRAQGSGVGSGWPSDFKDIDRHSSFVKSLIIHLTTLTGHPVPP